MAIDLFPHGYINAFESIGINIEDLPTVSEEEALEGDFNHSVVRIFDHPGFGFKVEDVRADGAITEAGKLILALYDPDLPWNNGGWGTDEITDGTLKLKIQRSAEDNLFPNPFLSESQAMSAACIVNLFNRTFSYTEMDEQQFLQLAP
jgi:hypothetical protein